MEPFPFKLAMKTFLGTQGIELLRIYIDNIIALTFLQMVCLSKQIWKVLLRKKVTTQYFPRALSKHTNVGSRHKTDFS